MNKSTKSLEVILAATPAGEIGYKNTIPWRLVGDLRRFKQLTMGHTLIMGRNTYESLPGSLDGRDVIVVSKSLVQKNVDSRPWGEILDEEHHVCCLKVLSNSTVYAAATLEIALEVAARLQGTKVFIAGGASLYEEFLSHPETVDLVHLTLVYKQPDIPAGETYDAKIENFNLRDYQRTEYGDMICIPNPATGVAEVSHVYQTYRPKLGQQQL